MLVPKHSYIAFPEKFKDKRGKENLKRKTIINMHKKEIPDAFVFCYSYYLVIFRQFPLTRLSQLVWR